MFIYNKIMVNKNRLLISLSKVMLTVFVICPIQVLAERTKSSSSVSIEEVIVSGIRKNENLIDVSLSVSAINGEYLKNTGINHIEDLKLLLPPLEVVDIIADIATPIRIRNASVERNIPYFQQSTSIYIVSSM